MAMTAGGDRPLHFLGRGDYVRLDHSGHLSILTRAEATMALLADGVSSLLIDGKLTSGSQGTFPTINPATEEVLGAAADGGTDDMGRAIEAARRAFDVTDWSRNTELRVRCIRQLREAMQQHLEELRDLTIAEVGAPRMLTGIAHLTVPGNDLAFAADTAAS